MIEVIGEKLLLSIPFPSCGSGSVTLIFLIYFGLAVQPQREAEVQQEKDSNSKIDVEGGRR